MSYPDPRQQVPAQYMMSQMPPMGMQGPMQMNVKSQQPPWLSPEFRANVPELMARLPAEVRAHVEKLPNNEARYRALFSFMQQQKARTTTSPAGRMMGVPMGPQGVRMPMGPPFGVPSPQQMQQMGGGMIRVQRPGSNHAPSPNFPGQVASPAQQQQGTPMKPGFPGPSPQPLMVPSPSVPLQGSPAVGGGQQPPNSQGPLSVAGRSPAVPAAQVASVGRAPTPSGRPLQQPSSVEAQQSTPEYQAALQNLKLYRETATHLSLRMNVDHDKSADTLAKVISIMDGKRSVPITLFEKLTKNVLRLKERYDINIGLKQVLETLRAAERDEIPMLPSDPYDAFEQYRIRVPTSYRIKAEGPDDGIGQGMFRTKEVEVVSDDELDDDAEEKPSSIREDVERRMRADVGWMRASSQLHPLHVIERVDGDPEEGAADVYMPENDEEPPEKRARFGNLDEERNATESFVANAFEKFVARNKDDDVGAALLTDDQANLMERSLFIPEHGPFTKPDKKLKKLHSEENCTHACCVPYDVEAIMGNPVRMPAAAVVELRMFPHRFDPDFPPISVYAPYLPIIVDATKPNSQRKCPELRIQVPRDYPTKPVTYDILKPPVVSDYSTSFYDRVSAKMNERALCGVSLHKISDVVAAVRYCVDVVHNGGVELLNHSDMNM